jgi:hypothetical protein
MRDNFYEVFRFLCLATSVASFIVGEVALSKLIKKRDRSRSFFSPFHMVDDVQTKEFYIFVASTILVILSVFIFMGLGGTAK